MSCHWSQSTLILKSPINADGEGKISVKLCILIFVTLISLCLTLPIKSHFNSEIANKCWWGMQNQLVTVITDLQKRGNNWIPTLRWRKKNSVSLLFFPGWLEKKNHFIENERRWFSSKTFSKWGSWPKNSAKYVSAKSSSSSFLGPKYAFCSTSLPLASTRWVQ